LDINDRLGLSETGLEASILLAQGLEFLGERRREGRFGAAALGGKAAKLALVAQLAPLGDLRGVDALAPKECTTLRGATRSGIIGLKDAQFVGSAAGAALRSGLDLR